MFRFLGFAERGGYVSASVASSGRIVSAGTGALSSYLQQSFPLATITVYLSGTLTLATIYSSNAGAAQANPFTADDSGMFAFYGAGAMYDVKISGASVPVPFTVTVPAFTTNVIDVSTFATAGSGTAADPWTGWAAAVNALPAGNGNTLTPGPRVYFPTGVYSSSTTITVKPLWEVFGDGQQSSIVYYTGTGLAFSAVAAINASNAAWNYYHDFAIYVSNAANTGAALSDVGGTYITIERVRTQGGRYSLILDQSELVKVLNCIFDSYLRYGLWLLNSANNTPGANAGFTNQITVFGNQFNVAVGPIAAINDEGGGDHAFISNNIQGGLIGIWCSGVQGLTLINNGVEGTPAGGDPIHLSHKLLTPSGAGGAHVGPDTGISVRGNTSTSATTQQLVLDGAEGGDIVGNFFAQYTQAAINISAENSGLSIFGNSKLTLGAFRTAGPFVSVFSSAAAVAFNNFAQHTQTYSTASVAAGPRTVTPATMGVFPPELIEDGQTLKITDADGTNTEYVVTSGCTTTKFDATFTLPHAAFFRISN